MNKVLKAAVCAALLSGLGMSAANAGSVSALNGNKARNDVDGDGKSDLLYYNGVNGKNKLMYRIMDGNRVVREAVFELPRYYGPTPGDFNGDGKLDLLVTSSTKGNKPEMWFGDGTAFSEPVAVKGLDYLSMNVISDIDGNGVSDIISYRDRYGDFTTFIMDGANVVRSVTQKYPKGLKGFTRLLNVGDFNGDGKADLVFSALGSTKHLMLFGNGESFESEPFEYRSDEWSVLIDPVDINGDDKADLLATDIGENLIKYRLMDGTQTLNSYKTDLPVDSQLVTAGDYNGDGKDDLILIDVTYPEDDTYYMWQGNGKTFKRKNIDALPNDWRVMD